jgi:hypothetical protein
MVVSIVGAVEQGWGAVVIDDFPPSDAIATGMANRFQP